MALELNISSEAWMSMNDDNNIDAFHRLTVTEQQALLKAIYYKINNKDQFVAFSWNPDQVQGAIDYLIRKGAISLPKGSKGLENAVLCKRYVINENDELIFNEI